MHSKSFVSNFWGALHSSGEIFMLAYVCLSIVCSASLFIAFGTVVPSQWQRCAIRVAGPCHRSGTVLPHGWQGYRLYRFREQSVFLRVLYYNVPDIRCRKKLAK